MIEWDRQALTARIKHGGKERYAAGSPDSNEIAVYRSLLLRALPGQGKKPVVLILGMTPELRQLCADLRCKTICIDINPHSIEIYQGWLRANERLNERIIHGDWLDIAELLEGEKVHAIMGDGVFGNLQTLDTHKLLLDHLAQSLNPGGAVILRKILIPQRNYPQDHGATTLVQAFRAGELNDDEFGFGMRIWGCYEKAYDADTMLLDNRLVFHQYDRWLDGGEISASEHALIQRYYFAGKNLIPTQTLWEQLLRDAGLSYERQNITGQAWYQYYPLYYCHRDRPYGKPGPLPAQAIK